MRWIGIPLLVATLGCAAMAQETQPAAEPSPELRIAPDARVLLAPKLWDRKKTPTAVAELNARQGDDRCYTMHSYLFERNGTDSPKMIGETTCTPAKKFSLKRVVTKPARLIPAN
jgi:hypothetical protein